MGEQDQGRTDALPHLKEIMWRLWLLQDEQTYSLTNDQLAHLQQAMRHVFAVRRELEPPIG
jgi:hypothetical protein